MTAVHTPPPAPTGGADTSNAGKRRAAEKPARTPRPPLQGGAVVWHTTLTVVAVLCLWLVVHLMFFGAISHARQQSLLFGQLRSDLAGATAPVGPGTEPGTPVALLDIAPIGVHEVVVEGTSSGDLMAGPGHKRDTVLPGQVGYSQIYGRATTYGGPFRRLAELRVGDRIDVTMGQGRITFHVIDLRREGDPLPQPAAPGAARLTLATSIGHGFLGGLTRGSTLYVDAEAAKGFGSPGGYSPSVPSSEEAMKAGTEALPLLTLWLALLVGLVVAIIAARQRWSLGLVWVVAIAPLAALSWLTTDTVMRLLPNLI
ncbi:sortase [Nocardioides maradonensis]